MPETFSPSSWADGSAGGTPITAAQLNRIESGIESMDDRVTAIEDLPTTKGDMLAATGPSALARVGVGTNGQVLVADSTAATGVAWQAAPGSGIAASTFTTKGDILGTTGPSAPVRFPLGTNGQVLKVNTATSTGLEWGTGTAGATTVYHVKDYGAVGNGTTNDATAVQAALNAASTAGGGVVMGGGMHGPIYKCNSGLSLPNKVHLRDIRLDFSTMTGSTGISCAGSLTALPALSTSIAKGALSIVFASAPSVSPGDILVIYNSTDSSFNPARPEYRAGEMVRAQSLATNTVTLTNHTYEAYTSGGTTSVYRMNTVQTSIVNVQALFKTSTTGVGITNGVGCYIQNVDLTGTDQTILDLSQCYDCTVVNARCIETSTTAIGLNYGLAIDNCQRIDVIGGHFETGRHGIKHGGGSGTGSIPNREITITGASISGRDPSAGIHGLDFHGNAEYCTVSNCVIPHGIAFGGDHMKFIGNQIGSGAGGIAIYSSEGLGVDIAIEDNKILARQNLANGWGLVDFAMLTSFTRSNGVFRFVDNQIDLQDRVSSGTNSWALHLGNYTGTSDNNDVFIAGNTAIATTTVQNPYYFYVHGDVGTGFRHVTFKNNTLRGVGISCDELSAESLVIKNNDIIGAREYGIQITPVPTTPPFATNFINVEGNYIAQSQLTGMFIQGTTTGTTARVVGNISINNVQKAGGTGASDTNSSMYLTTVQNAILKDNVFGDNQGTPTQARTYAVDTITNLYEKDNHTVGLTTRNTTAVTNDFDGYVSRTLTREAHRSAVPASGTWVQGDIVWNTAPAAAGILGWVCTTGGTPGTWKTFGAIAA